MNIEVELKFFLSTIRWDNLHLCANFFKKWNHIPSRKVNDMLTLGAFQFKHKLQNFGKFIYSHLCNKRGGWNKCGWGANNAKSLNVEGVINIIFWARIKFYSSKWPSEKSSLGSAIISDTLVMKSINKEGNFFLEGGIY